MSVLYALLLSTTVCACIQFLYIIFIYSRILFYKKKKTDGTVSPVSIIVAARNELENLKILLPMLLKQNYPNDYEIIVVNDHSVDDSFEYLYYEREKNPMLKIVDVKTTPDHISPKKYALTLGIRAAQYDHILLTDADCMPASENWTYLMQEKMQGKTNFVLGVSPYQKTKGFLNFIIRYETFFTAIQYIAYALVGMPYMGVGRNLAYKKSMFLSNKGFNRHLSVLGGDDDLFVNENAVAKNTKICISPASHVVSYPKTTWKQWIVQKRRHLNVGKFYKIKDKILLGLQNLSHTLFWLLGISATVAYFLAKMPSLPLEGLVFVGIIGLRIFLWTLVVAVGSRKIAFEAKWYLFPIFDLLYTFYVLILGIIALFTKPEKWS